MSGFDAPHRDWKTITCLLLSDVVTVVNSPQRAITTAARVGHVGPGSRARRTVAGVCSASHPWRLKTLASDRVAATIIAGQMVESV
jgi:hypothetical protein